MLIFIIVSVALAAVILFIHIREVRKNVRYRRLTEAALPDLRGIRDAFGRLEFASIRWSRWERDAVEVLQAEGSTLDGLEFRLTSETREDIPSYWIELRRPDADPVVFSVIDPQDELGETLGRIFGNGARLGRAFREQAKSPSGEFRIKLDEIAGTHLN